MKYGRKSISTNTITAFKQLFANSYNELSKLINLRFFPKDCYDFYNNIVKQAVQYRESNNVERKDFLQMLIDIKNSKGNNGLKGKLIEIK